MDDGRVKSPSTGGSSLMVIFAVLCLTVFAVLALSTLQADRRLFSEMRESVEAYYGADAQAQDVLAGIRAGESPDCAARVGSDGEFGIWTFRIPVSGVTELDCEVWVSDTGDYVIKRWALDRSVEWDGEFSVPVFQD